MQRANKVTLTTMASLDESDTELASAPTTPSSLYTDAEEESMFSALEEGDFDVVFRLLPPVGTLPLKVGEDGLTPLHYACQHGRLDVIETLVRDFSYNLDSLHSMLPTPLQIASASGRTHIVDYLLRNTNELVFGAGHVNSFHLAADNGHLDVMRSLLAFDQSILTLADQDGNTPLHHACASGFLDIVTFLCNEEKHPLKVKNRRGEMPLHLATKHCHIDIVKFLVDEKGCDPTIRDSITGCTPLHMAARSGCLDIVQYLAGEKKCDLQSKTVHSRRGKSRNLVSGRTALHYASFGGHCDIVTYLTEEHACDPCTTDDLGFTPLHLACQEGHSEVVRFFLSLKDINPNHMANDDGLTPIHAAALSGNLEVMKLLIDLNDGNPSHVDSENRTTLHYAARNGHTDIVQYLIKEKNMGANCCDESNMTPLHLAAQYGHLHTVKYLVTENLANPGMVEENGYTPLHLAANKGHSSVVEFLVGEKHTSCMVRDKVGRTPLHHACQSGYLEVVHYLTSLTDCDSSSQEKNLKASPLHIASSFGHLEVVCYLVDEKGCSPTCSDKFGSTPIHRAAASGHTHIMNYFVKERQHSSLVKNKFGNTPLHLACQKGQVEMVKLLLSYSKENMGARNQVGRMALDLTDSVEILSIFLENGVDPSKGSVSSKFPYLKCWEVLSPTVKIFLLGDIDTGKSTLAKALQGGGFFQEWVAGRFQRVTPPDMETSGIIPITFGSKHFGRVVLYDFAGHPSFHSSHSVIISIATSGSSPIFLLAVDLRKSPEAIEQSVMYWCTLILTVSKDEDFKPYLILVGTHEDELSKDGLRHKPAVLERIAASSDSTIVKFKDWISLDCRKPNLANMQKLRQFISRRCDMLHSVSHLDHRSCLLRSFILYKFQGTSVIEFDELLEYLSHANIPDIKDEESLYAACQSLHSNGYLLFLESSDPVQSSWIIHNQEAILSMVHGFHKLVEIPNPLGLVSISQLQTSLSLVGFNVSLATRYLLRMEFCSKLADRKILHSISGFEPPQPLEEHLFFPHLIRSSAPPDFWVTSGTWERSFGWYMICSDLHQFFGPRFQQLLLLRLASKFCFNTNPNSPFSARRSSCIIWRRGLSWTDVKGIEVVVEVRKRNKTVVFLARYKKGVKLRLDFFHLRSSIIREIREIKKEACYCIEVTEHLIHPESLKQSCPVFDSDVKLDFCSFKVSHIFDSLLECSDTVIAEQVILDNESLNITPSTPMKLHELFHFEPCMGLPNAILTKMFSEQENKEPILDDGCESISATLSERKWDVNDLVELLHLPSSGVRNVEPFSPAVFRAVLQRWIERNSERKTFEDLWKLFQQYSIFHGYQ